MKHSLLFTLAFLVSSVLSGCRVSDTKVATLVAPDVRNAACSNVVASALMSLPGGDILKIESIDFATGSIVVRYDSMKVGTKNMEDAIAQAGFAAGPFPANKEAAAKLPPECRGLED